MDLSESPAIEPYDTGGDRRIGLRIAAVGLLVVGFGGMVLVNVLLHLTAPSSGWSFGSFVIPPGMDAYAWGVFALGIVAGVTGIGLGFVARSSPKGRFVLPGEPNP